MPLYTELSEKRILNVYLITGYNNLKDREKTSRLAQHFHQVTISSLITYNLLKYLLTFGPSSAMMSAKGFIVIATGGAVSLTCLSKLMSTVGSITGSSFTSVGVSTYNEGLI